jgi:hypothetical protein
MNLAIRKNDHPGYSFERAHWALVTGVGPLNFCGGRRSKRSLLPQTADDTLPSLSVDENMSKVKFSIGPAVLVPFAEGPTAGIQSSKLTENWEARL